tara:strand:- start:4375 stop:4740 length:366 start_codon:yes stop_codon:yes gene_type:complete
MLTDFNKIVLSIAVVILIGGLIILGMLISKSMFEETYPPIVSDCPDYWDVTYDTNNDLVCKNISTVNKGRSDCNSYNVDLFSQSGSDLNDVICEKYKWAKKCNIIWDGVTNNNKACDTAKL